MPMIISVVFSKKIKILNWRNNLMLKNKKYLKYIILIIILILFYIISAWQKITINNVGNKKALWSSIILVSIVFFVISIIIIKKENITELKIFMYTIPILYVIIGLVLPMGSAHDELYHWFRSYDIVQGNVLTEMDNKNQAYGTLPKNVRFLFKNNKNWEEVRYSDIIDSISIELNDGTEDIGLATVSIYSPVQYIPQVIGIAVFRIFTKIPIVMAYGARLFNMLVSIVLLYMAIKITPVGKKFS